MIGEIKTIEDRKKSLIESGKKQGYVKYEQLVDELKGLDVDSPYSYSRLSNPTRRHLERTIASLEGGYEAYAFSAGMTAITVLCKCRTTKEENIRI